MTTTGRNWTRLFLPLAAIVFALVEGAWHTCRTTNADLAELAAETALVQSEQTKLEARVEQIAAEMGVSLDRASSEAQRARIRLETASVVDQACDLARRNGHEQRSR